MIVPLYDARELLIENVKRLMDDHPDKGSAAKLGAACVWPAGKKKGQTVGERTIRYLLDTRTDMVPPRPSPSLDLIVAIANAFNTPAWQLLVDDKQLRTWMVGKLFSASDAATDAKAEHREGRRPPEEEAPARKASMTARALYLIASAALAGCVSIADVDVTKYEPTCARTCSVAHSQCVASPMSGGTIHQQCKQSLVMCLQTCPPR